MMNQEVRKIMTVDPVVAQSHESIQDLSDLMLSRGVQQVPVVENGKLVGMVTTHDLWKNSQNGPPDNSKNIASIMSTNIIKITPIDKVGTAAELFMDKRFKTLPVVNLKNELKGVVTAFDVIKQTLKKEYSHPILYSEVISD